mmetsp:Transcript_15300/g.25009  ORF Transcript_15300/g.25009 Transcript_15300/m.25009 type:complete len:1089 (+) Transcript_15300:84-3350(+)
MIPARSSCRYGDGSDFKNGLRKNVGLDLGRRLLVVLKTAKVDETQAIRVVDHGEQQKEALRRLYDAQVLLQSYEEQLSSKDEQLQSIMACVKKAIRDTNGDSLRDPVLVRCLGLSEEELQEEGIVTVEKRSGGKLARFEAMPDVAFENQKWEEQQDRDRKAREMREMQVTGSLSIPTSPQSVFGAEHQLSWFKIPYWLKGDEETRAIIHNMKQHFVDEMNAKGHFDHNNFQEHLWQCGLQVAQRWAGVPNQELIKQAEAAEQKARAVQRESLQETSMLRQHIKRVERKYKELQSNVGKMQKAMSTMANQLSEARETASMLGLEMPAPHEAERRPSIYAMPVSPSSPQGHLLPPSRAATQGPGGPASPSSRKSSSSPDEALVDMSRSMAFAQQGPGCVSPLFGDDTLELLADQTQLQEMDNEIYEPLNQFDPDMRDLMMDCITEKVRRILSLDPSKYKNGRLPFGLKPDKGVSLSEGADLEEELERLHEIIERLKEENEQLTRQLEAARAAAERWKAKYMELKDKESAQPKVETKVEVERPPSPPVETPKVKREDPAPVIQGLSDEEVKRLLDEQEKAYKAKISALEKRIKALEDEVKKLKDENEKLKQRESEAKNLAEQERQKRLSERQLMEEQQKPKEIPPAPATDNAAALDEARKAAKHFERLAEEMKLKAAEWMQATRNAAELALRSITKVATITTHKIPKEELKFFQAFAASTDPVASDVGKFMKDSSPKFEVWISEALKKFEASFPKTEISKAPTPPEPQEVAPPEPKEKVKEVVYKGDPKEVSHLKQVTQRQQEEISRLLLTIDELRKRLENIRVVSMDAGPGVASSVDNIMEKVGLKDIMDPSFTAGIPRAPPVLKGVFERLYSDAIQRIQRYGLIRQQMLLANKTYASIVDTISTDSEEAKKIPDFDSLNDTTDSTIKGMWYQTEYLFRRACEYAMAQGVEASLIKAQQNLISEFEVENFEPTRQEAPRKERAHARRSERPVARGKEEGGVPKAQKDDQQTPFMTYMAALRESHGDLEDAKEKPERKRHGDNMKTLRAVCGERPVLATSHSLPALPKGRSIYQVEDGASPNKAAMFSSFS